MAAVIKFLILALITALVSAPMVSAAVPNCGTVVSNLGPCISYALGRATFVPPACCAGVRNLNALATTTADRRTVCYCLKSLSRARAGNPAYLNKASGIPRACRVRVGYPINPNVNCNSVT